MGSRMLDILAVFVPLLVVSGCSMADPRQRECGRYANSLRDPSALAFLEEWRQSLPATYDKTKLKRASNALLGIGLYTIPLSFDPSRIGLRSTTEVRLSIEDDGTLTDLVIIDVRGTMFYFLVDDNVKYFLISVEAQPTLLPPGEGAHCNRWIDCEQRSWPEG